MLLVANAIICSLFFPFLPNRSGKGWLETLRPPSTLVRSLLFFTFPTLPVLISRFLTFVFLQGNRRRKGIRVFVSIFFLLVEVTHCRLPHIPCAIDRIFACFKACESVFFLGVVSHKDQWDFSRTDGQFFCCWIEFCVADSLECIDVVPFCTDCADWYLPYKHLKGIYYLVVALGWRNISAQNERPNHMFYRFNERSD